MKDKMDTKTFLQNITTVHEIFWAFEAELNGLSEWINKEGKQQKVLDVFLDTLWLPKNSETRYIASARIGGKKFEPLDIYLEKIWKRREERDDFFERSYIFVREYYEKQQLKILEEIETRELLSDFYMTIFKFTHELGILYSDLFLKWNRHLLFKQNRELETKFDADQDAIMNYLKENKLFDTGHHGLEADRSYSLLENIDGEYISRTYAQVFPVEILKISEVYTNLIVTLSGHVDEVYDKKDVYVEYFQSLQDAWNETDPNRCVAKWSEVDVKWMEINTPVQPGHPIEYYEDKYRRAVSIEFDMRLSDPSLFESTVAIDVERMYEAMYDEIDRDNFPESYAYSLKNQQKVQLYIGAPVLQYGSFLCGAYSAQVVPNDDEVSLIHGKKIFAFPKFVLESQRAAPKMKLESEIISKEILEKYDAFLKCPDEIYYEVYDIETIGHEFGHTLWLTPWAEIKMGQKWLFKNIEEFKATAWGMVAYFVKWGNELLDEHILITFLMRSIKMMRYREVEDILPYYCECLIHLHILFESWIIKYRLGKITYHFDEKNYQAFKDIFMWIYTQLIFTYLNQMEAGNFLYEFVVKENWVYLPKNEKCRKFVQEYFKKYKEIGNEVL